MLREYVKEYGEEDHLEVISAEQTFQVTVPYEAVTPEGKRQGEGNHSSPLQPLRFLCLV